MSSTLSGLSPITTYLSIIKNEQSQVTQFAKTDPTTKLNVAALHSDAANIKSPTDLLSSKNERALQVVLGAYNMSGQSTETGLLKQLLTQNPSASGSLVMSSGSTNYLHFVQGMSNEATISLSFGNNASSSFTASGSAASSISFNNLNWGTSNTKLTAASPAEAWSYVLDDGSAAQSIATALTKVVQSSGTSANPVTSSYSVDPNGNIVGSSGAPAVTTSTDSAGNTVYRVTLATSSTGAATRVANVIGVAVPPSTTSPTTVSAAVGTYLLGQAMGETGFNVTENTLSNLTITNPAVNSQFSLASTSYSDFAAVSRQAISTYQQVLPLGTEGLALSAGQVLLSGGNEIGTIKSVDAVGNVTLTADSALDLSAGAEIDVAVGAGINNLGTQVTAPDAASTSGATLALGQAGVGMQAGQTITDGNKVIGIVKSVDGSGNVTLTGNLASAVSAGDTLSILPQVENQQTPALQVAGNVQSIASQYETNQYEAKEGQDIPGMQDALYFTRVMPTITSINQLMSDSTLLNVVVTNLGLSDTFGNLPFDQQQSLLTSKVNLSSLSNPKTLQNYVERFLAMTAEQQNSGNSSSNPALAVLMGGINNENSDGSGSNSGPNLLSVLYPNSSSSDTASILMLFNNNNSSGTTGLLSLFT
jgi:uncharacterized protein DUF1217